MLVRLHLLDPAFAPSPDPLYKLSSHTAFFAMIIAP